MANDDTLRNCDSQLAKHSLAKWRDAVAARIGAFMTATGTPAPVSDSGRAGWTDECKAVFLDTLRATSNVSKAAEAAGMNGTRSAYELRRRDPAFAQGWMEALEQGYSELELLLLRHALYGSEQQETVEETGTPTDDGGKSVLRVKTVRAYPHSMALQLLAAHGKTVAAYREARSQTDDEEALRRDLYDRLDRMRNRIEAEQTVKHE
jgi:hypothetical protein